MDTFTVAWNGMHVLCAEKKAFSELESHHLHMYIFSICNTPCDTLLEAASHMESILGAGYSPKKISPCWRITQLHSGTQKLFKFFLLQWIPALLN